MKTIVVLLAIATLLMVLPVSAQQTNAAAVVQQTRSFDFNIAEQSAERHTLQKMDPAIFRMTTGWCGNGERCSVDQQCCCSGQNCYCASKGTQCPGIVHDPEPDPDAPQAKTK